MCMCEWIGHFTSHGPVSTSQLYFVPLQCDSLCILHPVATPVILQGLYSLSRWMTYCKISWSLESTRLDVIMIVSLWNLTGSTAAEGPVKFQSDWKNVMPNLEVLKLCEIWLKTFYQLMNRGPESCHYCLQQRFEKTPCGPFEHVTLWIRIFYMGKLIEILFSSLLT